MSLSSPKFGFGLTMSLSSAANFGQYTTIVETECMTETHICCLLRAFCQICSQYKYLSERERKREREREREREGGGGGGGGGKKE